MIDLSHNEAMLFRILSEFFGREHVVLQMRVIAVCGGELPSGVVIQGVDLLEWAKANKCLFTIVDANDEPKMVIEFFAGFEEAVDPVEVEHQRFLQPLLKAAGVSYVTISEDEFSEIVDPGGTLDFYSLLKAKVEGEGISV